MANFSTTDDLVNDALWLAGEPQSSNSQYYSRALDLINATQTALVAGGTFADRHLPAIDWWWARARDRGSITLVNAFNSGRNIAITLTQDSDIATFASMTAGLSLVDYVIDVDNPRDQIPRIKEHTIGATTARLATPWFLSTVTASVNYYAPKLDYDLPVDFLRFEGPIVTSRWPWRIEVTDAPTLEERWPRGQEFAGTPELAALVTPTRVRFNRFLLDGPLVVEFEYIATPAQLQLGGAEPILPQHQRRILSLGAAYLMLVEKTDRRRVEVYDMFVAAWEGMTSDHAKNADNTNYGRILARPLQVTSARPLLRTSSGVIIG